MHCRGLAEIWHFQNAAPCCCVSTHSWTFGVDEMCYLQTTIPSSLRNFVVMDVCHFQIALPCYGVRRHCRTFVLADVCHFQSAAPCCGVRRYCWEFGLTKVCEFQNADSNSSFRRCHLFSCCNKRCLFGVNAGALIKRTDYINCNMYMHMYSLSSFWPGGCG